MSATAVFFTRWSALSGKKKAPERQPVDAPPGPYQVRATSAEGEVITVELTIEAGAAVSPAAASAEPSAEPMQLDRSRSTGQWIVIIVGLVVSAALGLWLIRSAT